MPHSEGPKCSEGDREKTEHEAEASQLWEAWMGRSWSFEIAFRCTFYTQQKRPFVYKLRVTGKTLHVVCLRFHPRLGRQYQLTEQAEVGSRGEDESPFCLLPTESVWLTEVACASFRLGLSEDRGLGEHI